MVDGHPVFLPYFGPETEIVEIELVQHAVHDFAHRYRGSCHHPVAMVVLEGGIGNRKGSAVQHSEDVFDLIDKLGRPVFHERLIDLLVPGLSDVDRYKPSYPNSR